MTPTELAEIFESAAAAFRTMPRVGPAQRVTSWPTVLHDWHAYGYTEARAPRVRATAEMVSAADKSLKFIADVPEKHRKLIWLKSAGFRWSELAREFGLHRNTLQRRYQEALLVASRKINLREQFL